MRPGQSRSWRGVGAPRVVVLVALACLLVASARLPQTRARSMFGQLLAPFGAPELAELVQRSGQALGALGDGAALAYEELAGSFSDFVGSAAAAAAASHNSAGHASNEIAEEDGEQPPAPADCLDELCGVTADPDAKRNVSQIIESRGFRAQELQVTTRDGYILTIQRIINPLVDEAHRNRLKPVILQHGLMSSSVDWVINSVDVRPSKWPRAAAGASSRASSSRASSSKSQATGGNSLGAQEASTQLAGDSQAQPNSLGFYLANEGYDVFLANSRGNVYGQRHANMSAWQPAFWNFTFDEQIKFDLPDVIAFVQALTNRTKLGYVGHSQGTTMALGLLADQPQYAQVLEPVVLLAPVAYVQHCRSPVKYFAVYTPLFQHLNMWFGSSNAAVRYLAPKVCGPKLIRRDICANIIFLSCGFDESQFNETRASAYLAHMPSGTSVKNIAHWGQEVLSGRFAHFDHGLLANQERYGRAHAPDYDLSKIQSKSIALFTADNDWLASPKDVARLVRELPHKPHRVVNVTEFVPAWNHIDFLYGKDCGRLVNSRVLEVFRHFDA